jgi:DNA-binding XRE family transcriptional regulator
MHTYKILDKYSHMPPNKLLAIQLVATQGLDHNMSQEQMAEACNVSRKTLWQWRGEDEFNTATVELARQLSRSMLPKLFVRLSNSINTASDRDVTAIGKLLFQVHGEITEKSETTVKTENYNIDKILDGLKELE